MLGQKDIDALAPDLNARVGAINFLLSTVNGNGDLMIWLYLNSAIG